MSHLYFDTDFIHQFLQFFLENIMPRTVTSASIAQHQYRSRFRIAFFPVAIPPMLYAVACKLSSIMACSNIDIPFILFQIVDAMRDNYSICKCIKIVIPCNYCILCIEFSIPVEIAYVLFLLCVNANYRVV